MRISVWSSDVCSSDLAIDKLCALFKCRPATCLNIGRAKGSKSQTFDRPENCQNLLGPFWAQQRNRPRNEKGPSSVTRSEEHTSELQSLMRISYAVFCLKKKK